MTSKQRAFLRGLAMNEEPLLQVGKGGATEELIAAACEALDARELIKISVLKNCFEAPYDLADAIAAGAQAEVVQVIGRKIVLYKEGRGDKKKIILPK